VQGGEQARVRETIDPLNFFHQLLCFSYSYRWEGVEKRLHNRTWGKKEASAESSKEQRQRQRQREKEKEKERRRTRKWRNGVGLKKVFSDWSMVSMVLIS